MVTEFYMRRMRDPRRAWRNKLLLVTLGGAAVLGLLFASSNRGLSFLRGNREISTTSGGRDAIISEMLIGAVRNPQAGRVNPPLDIKPDYFTDEALGLRIKTLPQVEDDFEIYARLVKPSGQIIELDPPSVTFAAGDSTFCCWKISEAGQFNLQIFRPEKVITTIPLTIKQSISPEGGQPQIRLF